MFNKIYIDLFECIVGYFDNNFKDVDLFGIIGNLFLIGVLFMKGFYMKLVFYFWFGVNVGCFVCYIFLKGFFKEFLISVVICLKFVECGVVFVFLLYICRGNVILGFEIYRDFFFEGIIISLIYVNNGNMRIVFDFIVFSLIGKWIWFFFSIRNNGVMFYKDCREVDIKFLFVVFGNFIF